MDEAKHQIKQVFEFSFHLDQEMISEAYFRASNVFCMKILFQGLHFPRQ